MKSKKEQLGRMMGRLHRHTRMYLYRKFSKWGLGSHHHYFIMALFDNEGITQNELTKKLMLDKAHTTRTLTKLEKMGYVSRKQDDNDQRVLRVYLTLKGKELLPEFKEVLQGWETIISKGLSRGEKEEFNKILEKMAENASSHIKKD